MNESDANRRARVARDLKNLAAQSGVDSRKIWHAKDILALGFRAKSPRGGRNADYDGFLVAIAAIANQLHQEDVGISIRHSVGRLPVGSIVMGLLRAGDYAHLDRGLLNRRREISDRIFAQSGPEASTIARYEPTLFDIFASYLIEAALDPTALSVELEPRLAKDDLPPQSVTRIWQHGTFIIDERSVITSNHVRMRLRANVEDVEYYEVWHQYFNDPRPGVITVGDVVRADIVDQRDDLSGAHVTYLKFLTPMAAQEERTIEVTARVNTDIPCATRCRGEFVKSVNDEPSRVEIQFSLTRVPQDVWWYRASVGHIEFDKPTGTGVSVSSDGFAHKDFRWLLPGERYGIAWRW